MEIFSKNRKSLGFTLIELTAVMAIIGIMVALTTFSFGSQGAKKVLEANAREFSGILREAQNYSLTGKQSNQSNVTCAYSVVWASGTATYTLNALPKNGITCDASNPTLIATYPLKQGATFSNGGTITFSLPWGSAASANVILSKAGLFQVICLNANGKIIDQVDPLGNGACPS